MTTKYENRIIYTHKMCICRPVNISNVQEPKDIIIK